MMSAHHWKERRNFWQALVFWTWLASFIFGFAGSDLFHSPHCPERLALHNATHGSVADSSAHYSDASAISVDIECAACALQLADQGVLAATPALTVPLLGAVAFATLFSLTIRARPHLLAARGPPISAI